MTEEAPIVPQPLPPGVAQEGSNHHYARTTLEKRLQHHLWVTPLPMTPEEQAAEKDPTIVKVERPSYDYDDLAVLLVRAYEMGRSGKPFATLDW